MSCFWKLNLYVLISKECCHQITSSDTIMQAYRHLNECYPHNICCPKSLTLHFTSNTCVGHLKLGHGYEHSDTYSRPKTCIFFLKILSPTFGLKTRVQCILKMYTLDPLFKHVYFSIFVNHCHLVKGPVL